MSFRFMRSILFFDLPSVSKKDKKEYRDFIKMLKTLGFYSLQESVFCKMNIDKQAMDASLIKIKDKLPKDGNVMVLNVTEKQFSSMEIMLGETNTDVVTSNDRIIDL